MQPPLEQFLSVKISMNSMPKKILMTKGLLSLFTETVSEKFFFYTRLLHLLVTSITE